jgi:HlyD family secretion protein
MIMTGPWKKWLLVALGIAILGVLCIMAWERFFGRSDMKGLASGNGRIEAVEIDIATKTPGRLKDILVREGDLVTAGQVVALMDTEVLEAQRRQSQAQLKQALSSVETAQSRLVQRQSETAAARSLVGQRQAELDVARKRAARSSTLAAEGATSQQEADDDSARVRNAEAALSASRAQLAAADAAVATARTEISGSQSAVEAARATVERIDADIKDRAPSRPPVMDVYNTA